ncbi:unnamed protein product [Moneuplotes crassus]|uniref:RING-type domain-containing protein n=1 Tax=Euplotes crassus TaxID=5936 RepID=A0AAD1U6J5_EUPCR|nr:unnamed protein product [Moneuplotes crassus]
MVLDYLTSKLQLFLQEYLNPLIMVCLCIFNPIGSIIIAFKNREEFTLYGSWAAVTIVVHICAYTWQMTKPVTDHPNCVRRLIRKTFHENIWKFILCRHLYKRNIQDFCAIWAGFFCLIVCYTLFTGMYLLGKVNSDKDEDKETLILLTVVVINSTYVCIACMALEVLIMLIVMIFLTIAIFFCFLSVFCPRCLAWRPNRDNDRVDRQYFLGIVNGVGNWEHILQYIYKYKRRHFKKDRYKCPQEDGKIAEESKHESSFSNQEIVKHRTGFDENSKKQSKSRRKMSPKVVPLKETSIEHKYLTQKKGKKSKKKIIEDDSSVICTICQIEFEEHELVCELDCGKLHIFHGDCLKEWFKVKMSCPTCRADLNNLYKPAIDDKKDVPIIEPEQVRDLYAEDILELQRKMAVVINDLEDIDDENFDSAEFISNPDVHLERNEEGKLSLEEEKQPPLVSTDNNESPDRPDLAHHSRRYDDSDLMSSHRPQEIARGTQSVRESCESEGRSVRMENNAPPVPVQAPSLNFSINEAHV